MQIERNPVSQMERRAFESRLIFPTFIEFESVSGRKGDKEIDREGEKWKNVLNTSC